MIVPTDDNTTEWFPVSINPVRVGVYQTRATDAMPKWGCVYSYWNGSTWCLRSVSPGEALQNAHVPSKDMATPRIEPHWRGLREQPK